MTFNQNPPIYYLNKLEYLRPKKIIFLWIVGLLESMFIYCICTQYLVGAPFALITAYIRRGMEVISLWHCWGGMEAQVSLTVVFSSSAFFWSFLIFLLTIPHRFSMRFRSGEFAGQSSTTTPWSFNQLLVLLAVWAGAKSCWKIKSASLKSWTAEGSAPKFGWASFSSTLFPSTQLSVNMLGYSTLWTASLFGNECLWLTLLVKGVNDCLLDHCQICSLPHDCVA